MSIKKAKGRLTSAEIQAQVDQSVVKTMPIKHELETSFMAYAMSVIVSRALPDVRDGFKPVHRRVLYAAAGLGMFADKPYKKSARLVGEVIGKYHPHGDSAVYLTMVRMAQNFSLRYCLIDGHGNFGSIDGDSPAAMRYTEARLSKIAGEMLNGLDHDTVDFVENYDGSEQEPVVLPSAFPNLLVNGSSGIAVGMATNMPTHNLTEVCEGIKLILNRPETTINDLLQVIQGPDFPTAGQILGDKGILDYFTTGRGAVIIRSKSHFEELHNGKIAIIVTEIPYMVNKTNLINRIIELVKSGEVPEISDLRDESSRDGIRVVIELKKDAVPEVVLNKLYKASQLQVSFSINNLALVKNQPRILSMRELIDCYIDHQNEVLIRRARYDHQKASERLHLVEGLMTIIDEIDSAIQIIKQANGGEEAVSQLRERFGLSEVQAKAVLEMKLRALTNLEHQKLVGEATTLRSQIVEYEQIIQKPEKRKELMVEQLDRFITRYGDARRTEIIHHATGDVSLENLIPREDILITMSRNGWFKRVPIETYRPQNRGGTGIVGVKTHDDDDIEQIVVANTHTDLLFFTNTGRVYRIRGHQVPSGSRVSKGVPANNFLKITKDERVLAVRAVEQYDHGFLVLITKLGLIKKTPLQEFSWLTAGGKLAITLQPGDVLVGVHVIHNDQEEIFVGSSNGYVVRFPAHNVRATGRTAMGVKAMNLQDHAHVIGTAVSSEGEYILTVGENGVGKLSPMDSYRLANRGGRGVLTMRTAPKTGYVLTIKAVHFNDEVLLIAKSGNVIRIRVKDISVLRRVAMGVKLMHLEPREKIVSVAIFPALTALTKDSPETTALDRPTDDA